LPLAAESPIVTKPYYDILLILFFTDLERIHRFLSLLMMKYCTRTILLVLAYGSFGEKQATLGRDELGGRRNADRLSPCSFRWFIVLKALFAGLL
jgi:hypothetical protein